MADAVALWNEAMPIIRENVTGVGVWTALKVSIPIALEDEQFVLGLDHRDVELAGHLRLPQTRRLIEEEVGKLAAIKVTLRVIEGTDEDAWTAEKRRDAERRRLQEQALERAKKEIAAGTSWDAIYDQLSRKYSATPNRSLPQYRARFFLEAVDIVVSAVRENPVADEMGERQFARCIERIAQYAELPSSYVATVVLEKTFAE